MSHAIVIASAVVESKQDLPFSPLTFAAVSAIAFLSLLGLTWSFRNTKNRHR